MLGLADFFRERSAQTTGAAVNHAQGPCLLPSASELKPPTEVNRPGVLVR